MRRIKLGINAVRAKSGGTIAHIKGILEFYNPSLYSFSSIYLLCNRSIANQIYDYPWLKIIIPRVSNGPTFNQLYWERFCLPKILKNLNIDILFNVDAGSICTFRPSVTLSQDMLSYEPGEIKRYGISKARLRLILLRYIQNNSLKNSTSAIFLTNYAANLIQKSAGKLSTYKVIPHGIDKIFYKDNFLTIENNKNKVKILYVSNTAPYKHQWHVVKAIKYLIKKYPFLKLELVGGGKGEAQKKLLREIKLNDPKMKFTNILDNQSRNKVAELMHNCDIFLFASSCENLPITLLEAMASKLPIACSNRGPMPSILKNGGLYFDPENYLSISKALEKYLNDKNLCISKSNLAKIYADKYSWSNCSYETFKWIEYTFKKYILKNQIN